MPPRLARRLPDRLHAIVPATSVREHGSEQPGASLHRSVAGFPRRPHRLDRHPVGGRASARGGERGRGAERVSGRVGSSGSAGRPRGPARRSPFRVAERRPQLGGRGEDAGGPPPRIATTGAGVAAVAPLGLEMGGDRLPVAPEPVGPCRSSSHRTHRSWTSARTSAARWPRPPPAASWCGKLERLVGSVGLGPEEAAGDERGGRWSWIVDSSSLGASFDELRGDRGARHGQQPEVGALVQLEILQASGQERREVPGGRLEVRGRTTGDAPSEGRAVGERGHQLLEVHGCCRSPRRSGGRPRRGADRGSAGGPRRASPSPRGRANRPGPAPPDLVPMPPATRRPSPSPARGSAPGRARPRSEGARGTTDRRGRRRRGARPAGDARPRPRGSAGAPTPSRPGPGFPADRSPAGAAPPPARRPGCPRARAGPPRRPDRPRRTR